MNRKTTKKVDESTLTTLCAVCRGAFLDAKGVRLRRAAPRQLVKNVCTYDVYCTNHDWNTLDKVLELDAQGYYMMNILDYLVGNTDRHWENWGLLVDNETNQPIRLHDLMDFNRAFQQYDTLDGANCLTVGKRHLSQKAAAEEAVRKIGLNQLDELDDTAFAAHPEWGETLKKRLDILKTATS